MPHAVSPTYIRYMRGEANETQNLVYGESAESFESTGEVME